MKILAFSILILCCQFSKDHITVQSPGQPASNTHSSMKLIGGRFSVPKNYLREPADSNSFTYFLRNLSLQPVGSLVKYYNGETKPSEGIYLAVLDMEISAKDLQQCADAVMRLRGEYLYKQKRFKEISFRFLGDGKMHSFFEYSKGDTSYKIFRKYMDYVFNYANTASLYKQLKPQPYYKLEVGDVFIQTGQPYGHAVIVMDKCKDVSGQFKYILAQSYMPAQETQILLKPGTTSPWFDQEKTLHVQTPEWTFDTSDLRTW